MPPPPLAVPPPAARPAAARGPSGQEDTSAARDAAEAAPLPAIELVAPPLEDTLPPLPGLGAGGTPAARRSRSTTEKTPLPRCRRW